MVTSRFVLSCSSAAGPPGGTCRGRLGLGGVEPGRCPIWRPLKANLPTPWSGRCLEHSRAQTWPPRPPAQLQQSLARALGPPLLGQSQAEDLEDCRNHGLASLLKGGVNLEDFF